MTSQMYPKRQPPRHTIHTAGVWYSVGAESLVVPFATTPSTIPHHKRLEAKLGIAPEVSYT